MPGEPPFRVIRPLGHGGMAAVFEVAVPDDPRRLAAKVLASRSPTARERFRREGEVLAQLRHPNVVTIHGSGELDDGRPYLLLDLVDGCTLTQHLEARGPLPVREALRIGAEVGAALAAAHARGIVHRDVKPDNVLVDADGRALLTDFGIALALDQERLTRTGHWAGTLHYMAPEQLTAAGEVGPAADGYALGAVLYELLAGARPIETHDDGVHALAVAITQQQPTPLRDHRPDVPAAVAALVHRCLEKDPRLRHPDAGALVADLEALSAGRRMSTRASVALKVRRAFRRRSLRVAAATLLLVAVALAVAVFLAQGRRARERVAARAEAEALTRELDQRPRARWRDAVDAALARCAAAHGDDALELEAAARALAAARDRAAAREATRALQRGATPDAGALAVAVDAWSAVPHGDDPALEAARAWTLLAAGRSGPALDEAARRAGDDPRGPWLRAWAAARRGDAAAALGAATSDDLRQEVALALAGAQATALEPKRAADVRGAWAALLALDARPADDARLGRLERIDELERLAADGPGGGPATARALALLALADAQLALGRDAAAAEGCARAHALLGADPSVPAVAWRVLGARRLVHPATAARLGEAQARAWLLDDDEALRSARAAVARAALDDPRALLAARLLEAEALDLLDRDAERDAALDASIEASAPEAAEHVARARARAAARRGEPAALEADPRGADALARGWAELAGGVLGVRRPPRDSSERRIGLDRARRAFRLALGAGVARPGSAWTGLGWIHWQREEHGAAGEAARRAEALGRAGWQHHVLKAVLASPGPDAARAASVALGAAASEQERPLARAVDLVAAVVSVLPLDSARYGPERCVVLLERIGELARTVPLSLDLALYFDGQVLERRAYAEPGLLARAEARHREREALRARLESLRDLARRASEAQMQDPGAPARLAELLRLDPGRAISLRSQYTVHGQFVPGGFDALALAYEVDPLGTMADLSAEADRLTRGDGAVVGQVVHVSALTDWERVDLTLPLRRDDDLRRALGVVHALELGKEVDAPTRLGALDAAQRLVERRPMTLAAWLLLGRLRLEVGDARGALEPLRLAMHLPDAFEDMPPTFLIVPLLHQAQAHGALRDWDACCQALEAAARLGWRNTSYARRMRWFRDGPRGPLARPVEDLLRRIDAGEVR